MTVMRRLETHYRDLCDIEFTIERGKLWMLQTRVGKRTAAAAFRIATQLVDEHLIHEDEALDRVTGAQLAQLMFPQFDSSAERRLLCKAGAASPGAAVGKVVFDSAPAAKRPVHLAGAGAAKRGLESSPGHRRRREEDDARGVPAESVHGVGLRVAAAHQVQQGVFEELAPAGQGGQPAGLGHGQQGVVLVQDGSARVEPSGSCQGGRSQVSC